MSFSIQTNVNSLVAQQNLNVTSAFQSKTIDQLTSGYRINESGDDAAGLAVANMFRSDTAELNQGVANGNDAVAQLQIMDGGMSNIGQILDRLKTLATQSASGTFTGDRATLNSEFQTDVAEIDRQAQSIGLNTGGTFAKSLSVYLGQGSGSASLSNGQVQLDLGTATVDSQSLGLKGMQAVTGTADLGTTSATSVSNILANTTNTGSEATSGFTVLEFSGPGFNSATGAPLAVSVNLNGVTDTSSLVTAINAAIQSAANGASAGAAAFGNAGILASVNTDANGGQQLAFTSSTTAFQVQAGDRMANALMGNFSSGTTGASMNATVTGQAIANTGASLSSSTSTIKVTISGGGMATAQTVGFTNSSSTIANALTSLESSVTGNATLAAAGITMSQSGTGPVVFTSASGQQIQVDVSGDVTNQLGLGAYASSGGAADYTSIQAATNYSDSGNTGLNQQSTLEISVAGGAAISLGAIALDQGNATAGTNTSGTLNPTTIVSGGSGNSEVKFSIDGKLIDFSLTADTAATGATAQATNASATSLNLYTSSAATYASTTATTQVGTSWAGHDFSSASGTNGDITITVGASAGGASHDVTLTHNDATFGDLKQDLQDAINTAFGAGKVTVGDNGTGKITLTSAVGVAGASSTIAVTAGTVASASTTLGFANTETGTGAAAGAVKTPVPGEISVTINGVNKEIGLAGVSNNADATLANIETDLQTQLDASGTGFGTGATYSSGVKVGDDGHGHITLKSCDNTGSIVAAGALGAGKSIVVGAITGDSTFGSLGFTGVSGEAGQGTAATQTSLQSIATQINNAITQAQSASDSNHSGAAGTLYGTTSGAIATAANGAITITNVNNGADHVISALTSGAGYFGGTFSGTLSNTTGRGLNRDVNSLKDAVNAAFASNTTLNQLGFQASVNTGALVITNSSNTNFRLNGGAAFLNATVVGTTDLTSGADFSASPMTLKVSIDGTSHTVTLNQDYTTAAQLVNAINGQLPGTYASMASLNGKNYLEIASPTAGTAGSVQVLSAGTANAALGLTDTTLHNGANEVDSGFGVSGTTNAGNLAVTAASSSLSVSDAAGTAQTGGLSFVDMATGTQALTISANNSSGAMQSTTITLAAIGSGTPVLGNDGTGASIDAAVKYINQQLQKTDNPTLQGIVAVKDNVNGAEKIDFLSSLSTFQVGVGTASVAGTGINAGVAETATASVSGAASTISINTAGGASAAVTAVGNAVRKLGSAQAVVGRGENQLGYAISLAQSQITNLSAAESQIRDTNVAQQAANLTKAQVLQQASLAAMAQANSAPQAVLALLRG